MEMLKFLTQKLRQQSLNEVQPIQPSQVDEDRDSGTESDEENAELEALEQAMQEVCPQDENSPQGLPLVIAPPPRSRSPTLPSVAKRPLQLVSLNTPQSVVAPPSSSDMDDLGMHSGQSSPQGSSDFERCSLDYDPDRSTEFDRHSSEEELAVINCTSLPVSSCGGHHPVAEKRKWSQVNRCGSYPDSSGSSDEEIKDLFGQPQPVLFSSSPPQGVQKLSHPAKSSPKPQAFFLANVAPMERTSVSPRKRHRVTSCSDVSEAASVMQRPCLDFEKMMQKSNLRKHVAHGISKARIVKIRSFNGSTRPPKCLFDPAVFSFRSISVAAYNPLPPVEGPPCAY